MNNFNRYRSFEEFETKELWSSEIVGGALDSLNDDWGRNSDDVSFEDDLDDDDFDGFDESDEADGDEPDGEGS